MHFQLPSLSSALYLHALELLSLLLLLPLALLLFCRCADADLRALRAARALPHDAFKGQVVLITGASSGIGEALALELAGRQATLVLAARRMDRLLALAERCGAAGAADAMALRLDMEAPDSFAGAVALVLRKYGRIDVLVNNAGRSQRALALDTPLAVDRELLALNTLAPMALAKAVLPAMLAAGRGTLVTTSSTAGKMGSPCSATYSASKHALQGFFDTLRMEVGARGIAVVNVCPGPVRSEITLHAFCETAGKEFGQPTEDAVTRLSAERCARLMAGAIHARLPECWLAPQPILGFMYLAQYMPTLYHAMSPSVGARRVAAFVGGSKGYDSIQNPRALVWGWLSGRKEQAAAAAAAAPAAAPPAPAAKKD